MQTLGNSEPADFILISSSKVDFDVYLRAAYQALGRSVTRSLDRAHIAPEGLSAFLATVAEFKSPGADPLEAVRMNKFNIARHIHFSFLVASNETTLTLLSNDLSITASGPFAVVSGPLNQWINAIIGCLTEEESKATRILAYKFLVFFEKQGLSEFWGLWQRKSLADRTVILEPKC